MIEMWLIKDSLECFYNTKEEMDILKLDRSSFSKKVFVTEEFAEEYRQVFSKFREMQQSLKLIAG